MSSNDHSVLRGFHPQSGPTYQSSSNAGSWQATTSQPLSGQQSYEAFQDFATRQAAYQTTKKGSGN